MMFGIGGNIGRAYFTSSFTGSSHLCKVGNGAPPVPTASALLPSFAVHTLRGQVYALSRLESGVPTQPRDPDLYLATTARHDFCIAGGLQQP